MSTLFSPIRLRELALPNRIMVAPMCQYSAENGEANDWHFTHINTLSLSGAAMFCIEATHVEAIGRITPGCLGLWNEATEAALRPILASVRKHSNIAVAMQLAHAGRKGSSYRPWEGGQQIPLANGGWEAEGPSEVAHKEGELPPRALDASGLKRVHDAFVEATRRPAGRRCYRAALRSRLSAASIPVADFQQANGQVWRVLAKPHAFSAGSFRCGARGVSSQEARRHQGFGDRLGRGRLGSRSNDRFRQGAEETRARLDRRFVRGGVAAAEDSALARLSGAVRESHQGSSRCDHDSRRSHHRTKAGGRHRGVGKCGHGRACARHALRSALGLACRGRARRGSLRAAAILAFAALDSKNAVRQNDIRRAVRS